MNPDETLKTFKKDELYLYNLIRGMVDRPENVVIRRQVDELGVLLTIDVHREDTGRVIGKDGKNIIAIRTIMKSIGALEHEKINVRVMNPVDSILPPFKKRHP